MRKVDPEKHEAKRQEILAAAITCFASKGFHRTSTAEICVAAGMSSGNLFHYFPSKQAIIAAIVEMEGKEVTAYFRGIDHSSNLLEELLHFLDMVLDRGADEAYLKLALEIAAEAMRDEQIGALAAKNDAELQNALNSLLRNAAARGQIDPSLDPADTARWISALIDGVFNRIAVDPAFRAQEKREMMRLLITRFLQPPVRPKSSTRV
ncbi:TetR family transcriptional regulator [Ensifer sp. Root31]|uniref:TetR/AcrR family transcriptional regulator n=1 Tax=Ensifer sp. Root31 TaxID=1736512 RepID=UPI00070F8DC9|nr:TetR/AcrR family transcriptional regulator [Ensifer sp. Root31]KQU88099.1 TetR family transcriptional regulator [Ensifer sp. Root31]